MEAARLESCPPKKRRAAAIVAGTPLTRLARRLEERRPALRIFNAHSVPAQYADRFERQLEHLAQRFALKPAGELERLVTAGPGDRSAAILTFDDALANHVEVVAPVLERWGVRAIFCVPAAWPDVSPDGQAEWFRANVYPVPTELHDDGELRAATWEQLSALAAAGHRIAAHGTQHTRLTPATPAEIVRREVVEARATIEQRLPGVAVDGFCWPGAPDPGAGAVEAAIRATYGYSLGNDVHALRGGASPYDLPRVNVEASWDIEVIDLQLSGVLDLLYATRRRRA
jgi:peptidoglycan/xylan/chitin deacetylase (PgdA/CDA1 family)